MRAGDNGALDWKSDLLKTHPQTRLKQRGLCFVSSLLLSVGQGSIDAADGSGLEESEDHRASDLLHPSKEREDALKKCVICRYLQSSH
jgi:hypothetical protein